LLSIRKITLRKIYFLIIPLFLTGCVSNGVYTPAYVAELSRIDKPTSLIKKDNLISQKVEILLKKKYIDLETLLSISEINNPEVKVARNELGTAAGRAWQAKLYPNPSLELEAEDIPTNNGGLSSSQKKVSIVQPINSRRHRLAALAAGLEREAHYFALQNKLREVEGKVRCNYVEIIYLKEAVALYKELLNMSQKILEISKTRFDAQAIPESEMIKAQIDVYELRLKKRRLTRLMEASSEKMKSLLGGVKIPVGKIQGNLLKNFPDLELDKLSIYVRKNHPSILASKKDIAASKKRVDQAIAKKIPDVEIRLSYGHNSATDEDTLEAGVSLPLPLFNRNQGRILEARHMAAKSKNKAELLLNNLLSKLATEHASYMTARDEMKILSDKIVPSAEKAFSQAKKRYQAGKTSLLDLMDAQRTLSKGRLSLLESSRDMNMAWANLYKIAGPIINTKGK
jgi:cobalt-zinc-cadmium efflux system outer membrane protein